MMDQFCGEGDVLLDLSSVWSTDSPTLSQCFSRSVLVLVPAVIILADTAHTLLQFVTKKDKRKAENETSYTIIARTLLLWMLLSLKIAIIGVDIHTEKGTVSPADLVYYTVGPLVVLLNMVVQVLHYRMGVFSSSLQFLYWLVHVICYLPTFKLNIERLGQARDLTMSSLSVSYFLLSLALLLLPLLQPGQLRAIGQPALTTALTNWGN